GRGYAQLGGLILNRRSVKDEDAKVAELAADLHTVIVGSLNRSDAVQAAEELGKTVLAAFPDSTMAAEYRALADNVLASCGVTTC
ncbi:MAG: nitrogenase iron protein, partial [Ruthenibacterium sp.]